MHIGKRIKDVLFGKGYNACWLAEQIPCERSNVYHIFKRTDIGIGLLITISRILDHDFFAELSQELKGEHPLPTSPRGEEIGRDNGRNGNDEKLENGRNCKLQTI